MIFSYIPFKYSLIFFFSFLIISLVPFKQVDAQEKAQKVQSNHELLISYQGRLTNPEGDPVPDGNHTIVFKLFKQETGGNPVWQETQNLETSNGVFSAKLGSANSMDAINFSYPLYLGIEVDGGDELSPRTQLTTVPFAQLAYTVPNQSITEQKLTDGAVSTDKLGFAAVDSTVIQPSAIFSTLSPSLEINKASEFVGINRIEPVTGSDVFAVHAPVTFDDTFGGMYINTEGSESWPFYGYATGGESHAWHVFDKEENEWILEYDFTSPRHRLVVDDESVHPGGDGDVQLGTSEHRWSEIFSTNGTVQTSDRRLKTDITQPNYGLEEVLQLNPVSYKWKDKAESERHLGLLAQDVEKVISEVVEQPEQKDGYLGMNYSELVPVLIKAIQEQQAQIDMLKEQLEERKSKNEDTDLAQLNEKIQKLSQQVENLSSNKEKSANTTK